MNAAQLNSARLARWSQNGEARLTLEAAAAWLDTIGFCPYLPTAVTGAAPSASFLEAVVGRPAQAPSAGERSRANELLVRMIENSAGVPLKLSSSLGEQPDSVASPEVLRYIYALRGDRNFKAGPSTVGNNKVTPLALHCWQAIEQQGPLDVPGLQPILGRDITETAIARALQELWTGLYVFPILSANGKLAQWELLSRRFPQQVTAGAGTGQAESQSAMVSLYLHAVVAAAEEEILAFLSPLAPQSKLREVIRGLGSMRQLDIIDIGGRAHVCLQGGLLPEMVVQLSAEQLATSAVATQSVEQWAGVTGAGSVGTFEGEIEIEREPQHESRSGYMGNTDEARKFVPKKFVPKKFVPRNSGTGESAGKQFSLRATGGRPSPGGGGRFTRSRSDGDYPSRPRSFAAGAGDASNPKVRGSDARKPSTRGLGERARRWEKSGEGESSRAAGDRTFESKRPFKAAGFKSAGFKPAKSWASKSASSRDEGAKPWTKRTSIGSSAPASPGHGREERPRRWEKPSEGSGASPSGYKKPYAAKSSGFKPGGTRSWASKTGASRTGTYRPDATKPWAARRSGESDTFNPGALKHREQPKRLGKSHPAPEGQGARGRADATTGAGLGARSGVRPGGRKPWAFRPAGRKLSGFTSSRFKSAGARSAVEKSAGSKSWVSRGAESRVGSAKSYAARADSKLSGAKPPRTWAARSSSESGNPGDKPKRREKPEGRAGERSDGKPGAKPGVKPFWARNPRGGKGSVAASRTNRPRGKKAGGKKSGKEK